MKLADRIKKLETAARPQPGELPRLVILPRAATPAERAAIRADVAAREKAGETILLISCTDDGFGALVDACGP